MHTMLQLQSTEKPGEMCQGTAQGRRRPVGAEQPQRTTMLRQQLAERDALIRHMQRRLAVLEHESRSLQLRTQVEEYAAKLAVERVRAERAEISAAQWKRSAMKGGERHLQLQERLIQARSECRALEAMLDGLLATDSAGCATQDGRGGAVDLCGRVILHIGGTGRDCARFRALVERQNGRFLHHVGDRQSDPSGLVSLLLEADAVLCTADSLGEDSVNRLRQHCRRLGKPLVLLPGSDLVAFVRGLHELAA